MSEKRVYFKLSPELGDGQSFEICKDADLVLAKVQCWLEEFRMHGGGDSFTVETVALTDEEFEEFPEL